MNNNKPREEGLSLRESRDMKYEKFRTNLRVLRARLDISAADVSAKIPLKNGKRCIDLEYGRGNPSMEEAMSISSYFNISLDDLMNKTVQITFT